MMKEEDLLKALQEHKPIIVNYGKGYFTDDDIKGKAIWDDEIKAYRSGMGIWSTGLLIDIIQGRIENTSIELEE